VQVFRGVSEGDAIRYAINKREPLRVEQENFRDAINGQETDAVTMTEGVHTLTVVEAILQSAREATAVSL
jgi:predicted dehydrogenase